MACSDKRSSGGCQPPKENGPCEKQHIDGQLKDGIEIVCVCVCVCVRVCVCTRARACA